MTKALTGKEVLLLQEQASARLSVIQRQVALLFELHLSKRPHLAQAPEGTTEPPHSLQEKS